MFFAPPADPGYTGCCHVFVVPLLPPVFFVVLGRRVRMCSLRHVYPTSRNYLFPEGLEENWLFFWQEAHRYSTLFVLQLFPSQWESLWFKWGTRKLDVFPQFQHVFWRVSVPLTEFRLMFHCLVYFGILSLSSSSSSSSSSQPGLVDISLLWFAISRLVCTLAEQWKNPEI